MSRIYYMSDPKLKDYFLSLPREVQDAIDISGMEIASPGELEMWAANYDILHNNNPFDA